MNHLNEQQNDDYSETFESLDSQSERNTLYSESRPVRPLSALSSCRSSLPDSDSVTESRRLRPGDVYTARTVSTARSYSPTFCSTQSDDSVPPDSHTGPLRFSRHFSNVTIDSRASSRQNELYSETFESIDSLSDGSSFISDYENEERSSPIPDASTTDTNSLHDNCSSLLHTSEERHQSSSVDLGRVYVTENIRDCSELMDNDESTAVDVLTTFNKAGDLKLNEIRGQGNKIKQSTAEDGKSGQQATYERVDHVEPLMKNFIRAKIQLMRKNDEETTKGKAAVIGTRSQRHRQLSLIDTDDVELQGFLKSKAILARRKLRSLKLKKMEHDVDVWSPVADVRQRMKNNSLLCSVEDYGIPSSVVGRLRLQATLERIDKICEVHPIKACVSCRSEEDTVAFTDYLARKRALVMEKLTEERLDRQVLMHDPLVLLGDMASYITSLGTRPDQAMQELLKPLKTRSMAADSNLLRT